MADFQVQHSHVFVPASGEITDTDTYGVPQILILEADVADYIELLEKETEESKNNNNK